MPRRRPPAPDTHPVTVTAARQVRPEQVQEFEAWAAEIMALAATFPGHLGSTLLRPGPGSSEYHLVYRFHDREALAGWERSPQRHEALGRAGAMVDRSRYSRVSGLESFFTAPDRADGPSRLRLTLLTVAVVLALQLVVQAVVAPLVAHWPLMLRALFYAVVLVLALGYVCMPFLTRRLARWLRPRGR
ncbi:antibiotic biosynthesis monooxygenase [Geodermatophilaceae bacterium NBWT11]|nr:antibiotic biosynthesis monooxygenase [Geodermatophilaceae bacterium NBWT11]